MKLEIKFENYRFCNYTCPYFLITNFRYTQPRLSLQCKKYVKDLGEMNSCFVEISAKRLKQCIKENGK